MNTRYYASLTLICICTLLSKAISAQVPKSEQFKQELTTAKTHRDSIILYYRICYWYNLENDREQAKVYARKGLELSKKYNVTVAVARGYYFLCSNLFDQGRQDSALLYAHKSVEAYESQEKKDLYYTYAINIIAAYYLERGNNAEALRYAQKELDAATELKDTLTISNAHTMLGAIHESMGNVPESIAYLEKALELNKKTGKLLNRSVVLNNVALLYMRDDQPRKAFSLLHESLQLAEHVNKSGEDMGVTLMLLAECYSNISKYDSALWYIQKAQPYVIKHGHIEEEVKLTQIYGSIFKNSGRYDSALHYFDKAVEITQRHNLRMLYAKALKAKAGALALLNRHREAYDTYHVYHELQDSISGQAAKKTLAELGEKYESDKKDKEITYQQQLNNMLTSEGLLKDKQLRNELLLKNVLLSRNELIQAQMLQDSVLTAALGRENLLKKDQLSQATKLNNVLSAENTLRKAALGNQQKITLLLTIGFALLAAVGILLFSLYRRQKIANDTISRQSDRLTALMKELHHRVKNNLQIISSLLSLQSFRIKDAAAAAAVKEGQQRIEAMSLIHQRLYTRDDITEINIREFITDLVDTLLNAYGYANADFTLRVDVSNGLMNVDEAIPLSLVINELVTNAFKYAYTGIEKPELDIRLQKDDSGFQLTVRDNGKGIDIAEWNNKKGSFGKELVQTFVRQLNGCIKVNASNGTTFVITFPYTI